MPIPIVEDSLHKRCLEDAIAGFNSAAERRDEAPAPLCMDNDAYTWGRQPTDSESAVPVEVAKAKFTEAAFIRKGQLNAEETHKVHLVPEPGAPHAWAWMIIAGEITRVAVLLPSLFIPERIYRAEVRICYMNNYFVSHIVETSASPTML